MRAVSLVLVGLGVVKGIKGLLLHLLRLQLVVLIHPLPHLLQPLILSPILQNNRLPLRLHLSSKKSVLLPLKITLHLPLSYLHVLSLHYLVSLLLVHPLPMIRQHSMVRQSRLTRLLHLSIFTVF